jgi:hypothetical protein
MERVLVEKIEASAYVETEERCLLHSGTRFTIVLQVGRVANIELQSRRCRCSVNYFENMAS